MGDLLRQAHAWVIGWTIVGGWALIAAWAAVLRLRRKDDSRWFWHGVSVAQILLVVQLVIGLVLLALGRRPGAPGAERFYDLAMHFLYGFGFPLIVLLVSHKWARDGRYHPYTIFAVASLIIAGLTARGWMVGVLGA